MGLRPKYNDLRLGRDMAGGLLVNSFNLSKICIVIFFLFFLKYLTALCATPTCAIMVRNDRVEYREKDRNSRNVFFAEEIWSSVLPARKTQKQIFLTLYPKILSTTATVVPVTVTSLRH